MDIQSTIRIFKEGRIFVAHALELDVASCGGTQEKTLRNLNDAIRLFLEEAGKMGTLAQILEEAGYTKRKAVNHQPQVPRRAAPHSFSSPDSCRNLTKV